MIRLPPLVAPPEALTVSMRDQAMRLAAIADQELAAHPGSATGRATGELANDLRIAAAALERVGEQLRDWPEG